MTNETIANVRVELETIEAAARNIAQESDAQKIYDRIADMKALLDQAASHLLRAGLAKGAGPRDRAPVSAQTRFTSNSG
jgi:uncharacterized protein (DUF885 family)